MTTYIVKRDSSTGIKSFESLEDAQRFCNGLKDKFNVTDLKLWKNQNDTLENLNISYDEKFKLDDKEFLELLGIFIK
ncbi:MAG: hypothetical protein RBT61_10730 [Candidatus Kapabacteria bacterium]|jgi:hypothetical protein|nr:hypothetical protein [Candidatus Kapabacteria bacterium]